MHTELFPNKGRKIAFVTFGGPTINYHIRAEQICRQAYSLRNFFTKISGFTDVDLKKDNEFWENHGNFIESNTRGYGFWMWKPHLINKVLNQLNENDILIYADAGCNFNFTKKSIQRLHEYIQLVDTSNYGILSFQMEQHAEYKYTKKQTLFAITNDQIHHITGQCMASVIIMRKTTHSVEFMKEWVKYSQIYQLINDDKTIDENNEFIDHRHDQSIYSLLVKKMGAVIIPDETYFHPYWEKNGNNYPFWATRQRY
jgi:hypothetical protein